jgi:hypothetical protein
MARIFWDSLDQGLFAPSPIPSLSSFAMSCLLLLEGNGHAIAFSILVGRQRNLAVFSGWEILMDVGEPTECITIFRHETILHIYFNDSTIVIAPNDLSYSMTGIPCLIFRP